MHQRRMRHECRFITGRTVVVEGPASVEALQAGLADLTLLEPQQHVLHPRGSDGDASVWAVQLRVSGGKGGFGKTLARQGRTYRMQQQREGARPTAAAARNLQGQRVGAAAPPGGDAAESGDSDSDDHPAPRPARPDVAVLEALAAREAEERQALRDALLQAVGAGFDRVVAAA